ncbi:MAG: General stress protein 16U [Nitrosomonadaceae bacterium]|nr:General stress protein 16U [Nitrosomonadaceae bacterium]
MSISLVKGQKVSLAKDGANLTRVFMGLGWDVAKKGFLGSLMGRTEEIDLDASCLAFDANNEIIDIAFYNRLEILNGVIKHTGDNRTGAGDGDDEAIRVDLSRVPTAVKTMVFVVSSYQGHTFDKIANAYCRVVDEVTGKELVKFNVSDSGGHTALIMAKFYKSNGEWKIHAVGEKTTGKTPIDLVPAVVQTL